MDDMHQDRGLSAAGHNASTSPQPNLPQVRSRVTVVCAECKRLKLKCDRRNPCGSCVKRDTVARCIYSPAAAEKVDLHSLNNRLLLVESTIASLTASPRSTSTYSARIGSCFNLPLSELSQAWTEDVDIDAQVGMSSLGIVKQEPSLADHIPSGSGPSNTSAPAVPVNLPAQSVYYDYRYPDSGLMQGTQIHDHPSFSGSPSQRPCITAALLNSIPNDPAIVTRFLDAAQETMTIRPSLCWKRFRQRIFQMLESTPGDLSRSSGANGSSVSRPEDARAIFFGGSRSKRPRAQDPHFQSNPSSESGVDTISFFSSLCAALALGALSEEQRTTGSRRNGLGIHCPTEQDNTSSAHLFALSQQAIYVHETYISQYGGPASAQTSRAEYDLDYLAALLLQITYMLKSPVSGAAHKALGLVGKLVNVARQLDLGTDPEDLDSSMEESEKDERRRLWWEIVWCDIFVSDFMGHQPLIPEGSFNTSIPSDSDPYFELKCRLIGLVRKLQSKVYALPSTAARHDSKNPPQGDPACGPGGPSYTLEHAASFEALVKSFLDDISRVLTPGSDHSSGSLNELSFSSSSELHPSSSFAQSYIRSAQSCELTIMAHRMVLRVYHPFLKQPSILPMTPDGAVAVTAEAWLPPHQATYGALNAAHAITLTAKTMYDLWQVHGQPDKGGKFMLMPAMFDLYPVWRSQFDAISVCTQCLVRQSTNMWASTALEDIQAVTDLYTTNPEADFSEVPWAGMELSEAVRCMVILKARAENAKKGRSGFLKRKHGDSEEGMPHLGSKPDGFRDDPKEDGKKFSGHGFGDNHQGKKDSKKSSPYPSVGIRVRPNRDGVISPTASTSSRTPSVRSSGSRRTAGSVSTAASGRMSQTAGPSSSALAAPSPAENLFTFVPPPEPTASSIAMEGFPSRSRRGSISHSSDAPIPGPSHLHPPSNVTSPLRPNEDSGLEPSNPLGYFPQSTSYDSQHGRNPYSQQGHAQYQRLSSPMANQHQHPFGGHTPAQYSSAPSSSSGQPAPYLPPPTGHPSAHQQPHSFSHDTPLHTPITASSPAGRAPFMDNQGYYMNEYDARQSSQPPSSQLPPHQPTQQTGQGLPSTMDSHFMGQGTSSGIPMHLSIDGPREGMQDGPYSGGNRSAQVNPMQGVQSTGWPATSTGGGNGGSQGNPGQYWPDEGHNMAFYQQR